MKKALKAAFPHTLPVMLGYVFVGGAFGLLFQQMGYGVFWSFLVGLTVYAGAGQFVALNFFAGGFTCSAGDMARLAALLTEDGMYQGQQLLSAETVAFLEQPFGQTPNGFYQCRPLRYRENMYGRDRIYYHTGSSYGFYGLVSYDPDTGDGVVAFTNGPRGDIDSWGVYQVCSQIAWAAYGQAE